ncbi:MAG: hypothetical protein ACYTGB_13495 [Planctomycetota bacterium]
MKTAATCLSVLILAVAASAGEVKFTSKPKAAKAGEGAKISFAVGAPTDVEVSILDAGGKVIRHLTAGVVGDEASAPLLKKGLSQEVVWDGKADWGKPAAGGPFKARVRIGMKPTFQKMIGNKPEAFGGVSSIACNQKNGELYVFHTNGAVHPGDGHCSCSVFSRDGKYLRTILPWPANTPVEKLKGLKRVKLADESTVPFFYQAETRSILPGAGQLVMNGPVVTDDGKLVFVCHQEMCSTATRYNGPGRKIVTCINIDGSMPESGIFKTLLSGSAQCPAMLALAPDGETWYAAGVHDGYSGKKAKNPHALHKFTLADAKSTAFIGKPDAAGSGADGFNYPKDVAVDRDGNLYVADNGNNRVAVFDASGKHLSDMKVNAPKCVEVNPKTGAVYVLGGPSKGEQRLIKFASMKAGTPAIDMKLGSFRYPKSITMALDHSAEPPVLWIASPGGTYFVPRFKVMRVEDKGAAFSDRQLLSKLAGTGTQGVGCVRLLSYDRTRDRLLINSKTYDPKSGKLGEGVKCDGKKRGMGSVGLDGNTYLMYYPKNMSRFDGGFKQIPFPDGKKGQVIGPEGSGSLRLRTRGVTADPMGNIYALWQMADKAGASGRPNNTVILHGPDGKIKNPKFIDSSTRAIHSPRLDYSGNLYLVVGARPKGKDYPDEIAGQDLGKPWKSRGFNTCDIDWYHLMYGCIVKFPPEGGTIRAGSGGVPMGFSYGKELEIKGAEYIHYGTSPAPSWRMKYPDTCLCESSRIGVDGWGRAYFPDTARFKIGVLGAGGKLICRFGDYGNVDSGGPKSKIPEPAIPLMWVDNIDVGGGVVYCGDRYNNRVVAVELKYAAAEETGIQ